jgi:hypothetical protein
VLDHGSAVLHDRTVLHHGAVLDNRTVSALDHRSVIDNSAVIDDRFMVDDFTMVAVRGSNPTAKGETSECGEDDFAHFVTSAPIIEHVTCRRGVLGLSHAWTGASARTRDYTGQSVHTVFF